MGDRTVVFRGDGEPGTPTQMAAALAALPEIEPDTYSRGGEVARLEATFAELLGTEAALFCPTGTLANHLAIRQLCGGRPRVLLQASGHIYNDTGDGVTRLSGITMVPLAPGRATFCAEEVRCEIERAATGRVVLPVGCLVVETPVRRFWGQCMPFDEIQASCHLAREHGIGLHLDGARLFMMSAATGIAPRDYCAMFDTTYVSLYKYFGAPFGAILAGPAARLDGLYHDRRMFGGGLPSSALAAAAALAGMTGFQARFQAAFDKGKELFARLVEVPGLCGQPFEHGSNIFPLTLDPAIDRAAFAAGLAARDVVVATEGDPPAPFLPLTINTTVLRRSNDEILGAFAEAAAFARSP